MQNEPMMQVQVDESEDTEWNDILREKGIIPQRPPSPTAQLEEALEEALAKQHANRLEDKDLSDLEELEDDEDEEFLEVYKQKRLAELAKLQQKSKFGDVCHINKPEYNVEVTQASMGNSKKENASSEGVYVFVHLSSSGKLQSRILSHLFQAAAKKYPEFKFVEIAGNRAIENYPEANCPTLIVYYKGDVIKNLVTLLELGGNDTNMKDIEALMVRIGALKEKDQRLLVNADEENDEHRSKTIRSGIQGKFNLGVGNDSDDSDFFD